MTTMTTIKGGNLISIHGGVVAVDLAERSVHYN